MTANVEDVVMVIKRMIREIGWLGDTTHALALSGDAI